VPAEAQRATASLLAIRHGGMGWSVPGAEVAAVERRGDWSGPTPLDVSALLGAASPPADQVEERVVVVRAEPDGLPLLARGTLSLLQAGPDELLRLPEPLRRVAPLIEGVALVDGVPALFVLSLRGLLEAWLKPADVSDVPSDR
jgi:hypothetical protein